MAVNRVHNPTDKAICVWWGHTPYLINPKETVELETVVIKDCFKHQDYKDLEIVTEEKTTAPTVETPEPPPEDPEIDPMECSIDELKEFCDSAGLVWNEEDLDINRDNAYEHLISVNK